MHEEYAKLCLMYPAPRSALNFSTPLQLLVATVLSAQTTDVRVNMVTPELFDTYPTAADLARANPTELEDIIHSTGFYHAKARHLIGLGSTLEQRFGGEVPHTMQELTSLPGVGRKTASVVLGNAFGIPGFLWTPTSSVSAEDCDGARIGMPRIDPAYPKKSRPASHPRNGPSLTSSDPPRT